MTHGITERTDAVPECIFGEQIHRDRIAWVTEKTIPPVESRTVRQGQAGAWIKGADALLTKESGITLGVRVADCVPILLYHPSGIIGVVHAGWRGAALEITQKTIEALNIKPFQLLIGIGPAICPNCFVVGEEVARQFDSAVVKKSEQEEGKYSVDLWQANINQCLEMEVRKENIEVIRRCTFEDPKLFSFRRGDRDDRFVAFIQFS